MGAMNVDIPEAAPIGQAGGIASTTNVTACWPSKGCGLSAQAQGQ